MTEITLRDGSTTVDKRLDRLIHFDERSKQFPAELILPTDVKTRTWGLRNIRLNQGQDGACVGFGNTHRLAADPVRFSHASYDYAMALYHEAQRYDDWPGEDYEGTSVLAGVKVLNKRGLYKAYHWCFKIEDYMRALSNEGPVVVGVNWMKDMFDPDERGLLHPTGGVAGGHCFILRGLTLKPRGKLKGVGPVFRITNSWGADWGQNGDAFITVEDWEQYLMPDGEGCVPTEQVVRSEA